MKIVGWSTRYLQDAHIASAEIARVLAPGGTVTMVVGNSNVRGCRVDNARMYVDGLSGAGLDVTGTVEREIPNRNRYLPTSAGSALADRMRVETIISAKKARDFVDRALGVVKVETCQVPRGRFAVPVTDLPQTCLRPKIAMSCVGASRR